MNLESHDIQGLIYRGYGQLPSAAFLLVRFPASGPVPRTWLTRLADRITPATEKPADVATHAAFGRGAMERLGLAPEAVNTFSRPFKEGMNEEHRRFVLGDYGPNDPSGWDWGAPGKSPIDLLLLVYAKDVAMLGARVDEEVAGLTADGMAVHRLPATSFLPDLREHFGFRDGFSQPLIEGLGRKGEPLHTLPPGEFILGYPNVYEEFTQVPAVSEEGDPGGRLPLDEHGVRQLGRNGSYLVFRQMEQHVSDFWAYLDERSREQGGDPAVTLGAKMVGRWPSGCPLERSPDRDKPELAENNDFTYWDDDFEGRRCPLGSHIRRTNPRDWLITERTKKESTEMVRKHRLLRRGRTY